VIVVDEYLAVRVFSGDWPAGLPNDELALPASRHWRLLQALHGPRGGQLSRILADLSPAGRDGLRHPHPEVFQVLDLRPLLDEAAIIAARYGGTGLLIAETLAAGVTYGGQLWFGVAANVGRVVERAAGELSLAVRVADESST
jgi:hypothetical protein